jgi:hypothetical protein
MKQSQETKDFKQALRKAVSVPRAELEKRLERVKGEKMAIHKRFKYVPAKAVSPL